MNEGLASSLLFEQYYDSVNNKAALMIRKWVIGAFYVHSVKNTYFFFEKYCFPLDFGGFWSIIVKWLIINGLIISWKEKK